MSRYFIIILPLFFTSCVVLVANSEQKTEKKNSVTANFEKNKINTLLNQWHQDVAEANFDGYFDKMTENSVFIGTDAAENWTVQQFKDFSKPYFDNKKTWDFKPLERHLYFNADKNIAWFDELLDTWMGICRGSGVLSKKNGIWKIEHYVLSVVIPNDDIKKVIELKKEKDNIIIQQLKLKSNETNQK